MEPGGTHEPPIMLHRAILGSLERFEAQTHKVPFMLIAGEREAADGTVAVRRRDTREQEVVPFEQFLELIKDLRARRALDLGQPLVKS